MPLAQRLADYRIAVGDANALMADALRVDTSGAFVASAKVREQAISASFLNFHIAWETFLEAAFLDYMLGDAGVSGVLPQRIAMPPTREHALKMLIGNQKYFDFGNHQFVLAMADLHFVGGGPFRPHLAGAQVLLDEVKTMRNCCAHIQKTTQSKLDTLAQHVLQATATFPCRLGPFLLMQHPGERAGVTIMSAYQQRVDVLAELIANGYGN